MRTLIAIPLGLLAGAAYAQQVPGSQCGALLAPAASAHAPLIAPLSPELPAPAQPLGAPSGVLAQAFDESLAVDNVLQRMRLQQCLAVAKAAAPATTVLPAAGPAAYQPRTQFDNTPWRFDMSQNGKRMTAEEFDAWMKARGVRVAKGAPGAAAPAPVEKPKDEK